MKKINGVGWRLSKKKKNRKIKKMKRRKSVGIGGEKLNKKKLKTTKNTE